MFNIKMDTRIKEHKQGILAFMIELREANTKGILRETVLKSLSLDNTLSENKRLHGATQVLATDPTTFDD
jgi:hypothetical protein